MTPSVSAALYVVTLLDRESWMEDQMIRLLLYQGSNSFDRFFPLNLPPRKVLGHLVSSISSVVFQCLSLNEWNHPFYATVVFNLNMTARPEGLVLPVSCPDNTCTAWRRLWIPSGLAFHFACWFVSVHSDESVDVVNVSTEKPLCMCVFGEWPAVRYREDCWHVWGEAEGCFS